LSASASASASTTAIASIVSTTVYEELVPPPAVERSVSFSSTEVGDPKDAQMEEVIPHGEIRTWPQQNGHLHRHSRSTVVHGADTTSVVEKIAVLRFLEKDAYAIPDYLAQYRNRNMADLNVQPRFVD
jgi:hypothetical protein